MDKNIIDLNAICSEWVKNKKLAYLNPSSSLTNSRSVSPKKWASRLRRKKNTVSTDLGPPPSVYQPEAAIETSVMTDDGDELVSEKYSVSNRIIYNDQIKPYFAKIAIEDGKACMSENKTLLQYLNSPTLLGYGSFGNVYGVDIPRTSPRIKVAVKEGKISYGEFRKALKKQYPLEYLYNKLVNDLIDEKVCPNFAYTFAIFFCDKCLLNEFSSYPITTRCSETVVEYFDYTLDKLVDLKDDVVWSVLFQILFALASVHTKYGIFHNDVKKENILIKQITPGGYWVYQVNNNTYYVPNCGYIAALNDFGVSTSYKPGFTEKDYGRRQAKVIEVQGKPAYFKPFNTQFYPSRNNKAIIKIAPNRYPNTQLTWNYFYKDFSSEPTIPVDLNDMVKFPVLYFNYDIVDAIRSFIGGKRTGQPGTHKKINVSSKVVKELQGFFQIELNKPWPVDKVYLFSCIHVLDRLFNPLYRDVSSTGEKFMIEKYLLSY